MVTRPDFPVLPTPPSAPPPAVLPGAIVAARGHRAALSPTARDAVDRDLVRAVAVSDLPRVQAALAAGADPDAMPLETPDDALALLGESLVTFAARHGLTDLAQMLVTAGASLDRPGACPHQPLHAATTHAALSPDAASLASWLLAAGADPRTTNVKGETVLHLAAREGLVDLVREILQQVPASVHCATSNGTTALHVAAHFRHPLIVQLLLAAGADPLVRSRRGFTAFHEAVWRSDRSRWSDPPADCLRLLLATGGPLPSSVGDTPGLLYAAIWSEAATCAVLLLQHGAPFTDHALRALEQPSSWFGSPPDPSRSATPVLDALSTAVRDGTLPRDAVLPLLQSQRADIRAHAICLLGAPVALAPDSPLRPSLPPALPTAMGTPLPAVFPPLSPR